MKRIELLLGTMILISLVFKMFYGPELNSFLIMSLIGLSIFYTYFSIIYFNNIPLSKVFKKEQYEDLSKLRIIGTIALGIGLGFTLLAILFTLMSWPFNNFYSIGIPIIINVGLIVFIKYYRIRKDDYIKILKRVFIVGLIGIIFWINPYKVISKFQDNREIIEEIPE